MTALSDLARCFRPRRTFGALCDWCGVRPWVTRITVEWHRRVQVDLVCGRCLADHLGSLA